MTTPTRQVKAVCDGCLNEFTITVAAPPIPAGPTPREIRERLRELAKFVVEKGSEGTAFMALMEARGLGRAEAAAPPSREDLDMDEGL